MSLGMKWDVGRGAEDEWERGQVWEGHVFQIQQIQ